MSISRDVTTNEQNKFKESSSTSGQAGVVVLNPDGSNISSLPTAVALNSSPAKTTVAPFVGAATANNDGTNLILTNQAAHGLNTAGSGLSQAAAVYEFDDTSPTAITENQFGYGRMSSRREQYAQLRDAAGNERGLNIDTNGEIGIGAIRTSITPGTSAAHLGKAEDAAHVSGDTGVMLLAVRQSSPTDLSAGATNGDYEPLQVDANGAVWFSLATNIEGEDSVNHLMGILPKPVASSTYSATSFATFGTSVAISAKGSAGNLYCIIASNINAAVRYLQIHNKATAPASTNVPILSLPIPAGTATNPGYLTLDRRDFGEGGRYLSTGVAIGISTAEATYTAATTTDHDIYGEYI